MVRDILNDHASGKDPLFIATGKYALFFNKAHNTPPVLQLSPLLVSKKTSGLLFNNPNSPLKNSQFAGLAVAN